jgi:hypothetical protein
MADEYQLQPRSQRTPGTQTLAHWNYIMLDTGRLPSWHALVARVMVACAAVMPICGGSSALTSATTKCGLDTCFNGGVCNDRYP